MASESHSGARLADVDLEEKGSGEEKRSSRFHRVLNPMPVLDEQALLQAFREQGIKFLHAPKVWKHVIRTFLQQYSSVGKPDQPFFLDMEAQHRIFDSIPDIPRAARELLKARFAVLTSKLLEAVTNRDGSTTKLLIELQDGKRIESVIIRHPKGRKGTGFGADEGNGLSDLLDPVSMLEAKAALEERNRELKQQRQGQEGQEQQKGQQEQQEEKEEAAEEPRGRQRSDSVSSRATTASVASSVWDGGRVTLCVSSQVGCAMGCTFCATGTLGLMGNLWAGEIMEQLLHALRLEKIRNVVFMGMGEPLHNYDAVLSAINGMIDDARFGLAPSRITLSTVGVIPRIIQLTKDAPHVNLALSLHAPNQELRARIVPSARTFKLDKLMAAVDDHLRKGQNRVMFEYCMLAGVNDSPQHAHELGRLLQGRDAVLNLIPYNATETGMGYKAPSEAAVLEFMNICRREYGILTTVRKEHGQDINGACGQLALTSFSRLPSSCSGSAQGNKESKDKPVGPVDMEDLFANRPTSPSTRKRPAAPKPANDAGAQADTAETAAAASPASPVQSSQQQQQPQQQKAGSSALFLAAILALLLFYAYLKLSTPAASS